MFCKINDDIFGNIFINTDKIYYITLKEDRENEKVVLKEDKFKHIIPYKILIYFQNKEIKDKGADIIITCKTKEEAEKKILKILSDKEVFILEKNESK